MPTVSSPPEVISGISFRFGRIMVKGPGQNRSASFSASGGTVAATCSSACISAMCTISGLSAGLPFAAKICRTASGFLASAASP